MRIATLTNGHGLARTATSTDYPDKTTAPPFNRLLNQGLGHALTLAGSTEWVPLALGFDRVRFLRPVCLGETVTVRYVVSDVDVERARMNSAIDIHNERGNAVVAGTHIMKWVSA